MNLGRVRVLAKPLDKGPSRGQNCGSPNGVTVNSQGWSNPWKTVVPLGLGLVQGESAGEAARQGPSRGQNCSNPNGVIVNSQGWLNPWNTNQRKNKPQRGDSEDPRSLRSRRHSERRHFLIVANQQDAADQHGMIPGLAFDRSHSRQLFELVR